MAPGIPTVMMKPKQIMILLTGKRWLIFTGAIITTEVRSEVTQQAIEEIYKELKRLSAEPVPDDELQMVRNYMLGTFMRNIDGAFHLIDRCKSIVLFDMDYDYFERHIAAVRNTTPEQLMQLAGEYLTEDSFYEVVAGKK